MPDGIFKFEDCLLKHYVRSHVWLPRCKERLKDIRKGATARQSPRRLRYFTFCAVGALDVLLLDREKVVRRSDGGEFDTVFFFDRDEEAVIETRKRIPGANGFPGDFVKIVLQAQDGDEDLASDIPSDAENTRAVRAAQNHQAQLRRFVSCFPFDVINLDVEQYLFRPKEDLPGNLTRALRKIFEWQRRNGVDNRGKNVTVSDFVLMFTTPVGPNNLPAEYITYLKDDCLKRNLETYAQLQAPFHARSNGRDIEKFFEEDFDGAFKLAVPKSLSELALEQDWHIDAKRGIEVYQFDRPSSNGSYRMLHVAMLVRRQEPPKNNRGPGQGIPDTVLAEHKAVLQRLFESDPIQVNALVVGAQEAKLKADLEKLFEHRRKIYQPPEPAA